MWLIAEDAAAVDCDWRGRRREGGDVFDFVERREEGDEP